MDALTLDPQSAVRRLSSALRFLGRSRWLAYVLAASLPLVMRLSLVPSWGIPEPATHDEFSYLLGADTFARGRLANPTHPLWEHFDTFHINQQPTYATKYPPAQSLFLALGQTVFGHPWFGVLISISVLCVALSWMLQGWLSRPYAFLGTLLAVSQFGVTGYWVNSYWGGAVAAAGGALVLGALPRLVRHEHAGTLLAAAGGVALLANSRPYEGAFLAVGTLVALIWWRRRARRPLRRLVASRSAVPAALLLCAVSLGSLFYNYRVTGSAWTLPYSINQRTYASTPQFWLLPKGQPAVYLHEPLRQVWVDWYGGLYDKARANPRRMVEELFDQLSAFFAAPVRLTSALAVLLVATRRVRLALAVAAAVGVATLLEVIILPHYFAPAAGAVVVLAAIGMRHVVRTAMGLNWLGTAFVLGVFFGYCVIEFESRVRRSLGPQFGLAAERRAIVDALERQNTRHLVIVRYAAGHDGHLEWVFNAADIDSSSIVWARDMGVERNRLLLDYYPDRMVWLVEPDRPKTELRLTPYPRHP